MTYRLDGTYANFRPGTGALGAAIKSAYLQGEPLLFVAGRRPRY